MTHDEEADTWISIHAPLRERRVYFGYVKHTHQISIHAPLRERLRLLIELLPFRPFQSTLPCGSDD